MAASDVSEAAPQLVLVQPAVSVQDQFLDDLVGGTAGEEIQQGIVEFLDPEAVQQRLVDSASRLSDAGMKLDMSFWLGDRFLALPDQARAGLDGLVDIHELNYPPDLAMDPFVEHCRVSRRQEVLVFLSRLLARG